MRNMRCIRHSGRTRASTVPRTASSSSASASAWRVCLPLAAFVPSAGAGLRVPRVKLAAAELGDVGAVPGWFAKTFGASGRAGRTFRVLRKWAGLNAKVAARLYALTSLRDNFRTCTRPKARTSGFRAVGMRPRKMSMDLGLEYTRVFGWGLTYVYAGFNPGFASRRRPRWVKIRGRRQEPDGKRKNCKGREERTVFRGSWQYTVRWVSIVLTNISLTGCSFANLQTFVLFDQ